MRRDKALKRREALAAASRSNTLTGYDWRARTNSGGSGGGLGARLNSVGAQARELLISKLSPPNMRKSGGSGSGLLKGGGTASEPITDTTSAIENPVMNTGASLSHGITPESASAPTPTDAVASTIANANALSFGARDLFLSDVDALRLQPTKSVYSDLNEVFGSCLSFASAASGSRGTGSELPSPSTPSPVPVSAAASAAGATDTIPTPVNRVSPQRPATRLLTRAFFWTRWIHCR